MRRPHLDWLRGVGVLIMIAGHALDAWTRAADRDTEGYRLAILVAGIGAPLFLFLAGVALPLAAASRLRKGLSASAVTRVALRRGAWIFALAFLFRLQSWVISGGAFPGSLLKVDILNIMGIAMMGAALLWGLGRQNRSRVSLFAGATAIIAMSTPLVRTSALLAVLPDPVEWYLRPSPGSTTFTLFPWAGFLTAGAAIGILLSEAATARRERILNAALVVAGIAIGVGGYGTSFLPALYESSTFWTSSPTFFFVRVGILVASIPLADWVTRIWPSKALQHFGRASLFVYWIHVEMAYGVLSTPLHRQLPFGGTLLAIVAFAALLFALVRLKERVGRGRSPEPTPSSGSPRRVAGSHAS